MELTFINGSKNNKRFKEGIINVSVVVSKDQEHNMEPLNELLNDEKG